jgi:hypothetical protein
MRAVFKSLLQCLLVIAIDTSTAPAAPANEQWHLWRSTEAEGSFVEISSGGYLIALKCGGYLGVAIDTTDATYDSVLQSFRAGPDGKLPASATIDRMTLTGSATLADGPPRSGESYIVVIDFDDARTPVFLEYFRRGHALALAFDSFVIQTPLNGSAAALDALIAACIAKDSAHE